MNPYDEQQVASAVPFEERSGPMMTTQMLRKPTSIEARSPPPNMARHDLIAIKSLSGNGGESDAPSMPALIEPADLDDCAAK